MWATEQPFELHPPQGFLSGNADFILDHDGGRTDSLAIVDDKSGTDSASDESSRFQLQVYAAAARSEGLHVTAAYVARPVGAASAEDGDRDLASGVREGDREDDGLFLGGWRGRSSRRGEARSW